MIEGPLEENAVVLAAAKASVPGRRLLELIAETQRHLRSRHEEYVRRYECVYEDDETAIFFVEDGHWADIGSALGLDHREWKALARAHREQLRMLGRDIDRHEEFETALDVRDVVVIGTDTDDTAIEPTDAARPDH